MVTKTFYTLYIPGEEAVNIAAAICAGHCYTHLESNGQSIAQLEPVLDDLVDVSYIDEQNVCNVIKMLASMGFSGYKATLCKSEETGCIANDVELCDLTI